MGQVGGGGGLLQLWVNEGLYQWMSLRTSSVDAEVNRRALAFFVRTGWGLSVVSYKALLLFTARIAVNCFRIFELVSLLDL